MFLRHLGVLLVSFFISLSTLSAQTVSGSIGGVVVDPHGAVIPSVNVKLISESTGAIREATTDTRGEFVFNAVQPDSYALTVEQTGFKKYEKKNIVLNPSDRLSAGQIQLQIGSANESVSVVAEGAAVQTASSERSGIVTSEQVEDLTVINRDFSVLASLQPGVVYNPGAEAQSFSGNSTFNVNGGRTGQNNIGIQGVPVENSNGGNYNTFISMNAIQEVKIVSSSSQAEFGRKSGATMQAVVKQGTTQYHGEVYWYQRNNVFNALQSIQKTNHLADPEYHFITAGANIGGPVYIPKLIPRDQKKFFFFFSEEQQREVRPQDVRQVTVPTLLERMGDFSQSGAIADPLKTGTCKKIGDPGCFTNNKIPASRIDPRTQAYLNLLPLPNTSGSPTSNKQFNYQVQESLKVPKHSETGRFDVNATSNTHFYAVLSRWWDDEKGFSVPAGNANWGWLPSEYNPISRSASVTGTHIFNPTLIFEGTMTASKWTEGNHPSAAVVATRSRTGTGINLPQLFPVNNPLDILPAAKFGGIPNPAEPSINSRYPITGTENVFTWTPQLTKVQGAHTFKTGMFIEYWQEHKGVNGNFTGTYTFSSNSSNYTTALGNTGNAFANALIGDFQSYEENNTRPPLISHYTGLEWFIQDNWKATRNLTLDIGVRLGWSRPFHNVPGNEAGFVPELYNPAQRVQLYGAAGAPAPPNSALSGAIVPGSGNPVDGTVTNGIIPGFAQAFDPNYPPGLRNSDHVKAAPRFGFAYDPFGNGKTAIRGGFGMYYDFRERDNFFTNDFKSTPLQLNPTIEFGQTKYTSTGAVQSFGIDSVNPTTVSGFNFPSGSFAFQRNRRVPYMINYSFGIQREVGFKTVVDVAYVASLGRHLLWEVNLNSVPAGSTTNPLLPSGYPNNALRPYLGYTDIQQLQYEGTSNYNSLQVAVNRRFAKTFDFGLAYTWSKAMDFADKEDDKILNPLIFNNIPFRKWQYSRAGFDHAHIFKASWTYDFPNASKLWDNGFVRGVLDSWRISGITTYQTGAPNGISLDNVCALPAGVAIDPTKSCSALGGKSNSGTSWSGSPTDASRVLILPGPANNVTTPFAHVQGLNGFALAPAPQGTVSLGPRSYYIGPGVEDWDVSLFKQIPLHSERFKLQFRAEVYDLFNHTNFKQLSVPSASGSGGDNNSKTQFQLDYLGHFVQTNPDLGRYSAAEFKRRMQLGLTLRF